MAALDSSERPLTARGMRTRSWLPDTLGVVWVLAAAFAVLLPALVHGASLGPFDALSAVGLSKQPGVSVHNFSSLDQITQTIPWSTLAWTQVHSGHLPLWNPYSLLGMPLAFNWISAPFSVPSLIGYLVPLHLAYTVQILVTLVIAGTGVYVFCRVMGLGVLGCVMAATVCELSGPFIVPLGWPLIQVMSWAGWLFALALLIVRGRHRARDAALFAVVLACMVYSGMPELVLLLGLALVAFLAVLLIARARWLGGSGSILRPILDLALASAAGAGLGAPLALPGLQLANHSIRGRENFTQALPSKSLVGLVFQGFYGLPENHLFGVDYVGFYVGAIAVVLAMAAVVLRRRYPEVVALAGAVVLTAALTFVTPLLRLIHALPFHLGRVSWFFALIPMAFCIAILAGVGTDVLVRSHDKRAVRNFVGGGFVAMGVIAAALWSFGRSGLSPIEARMRAQSFIWPTIETVVGLAVVGGLTVAHRRVTARHSGRRDNAGWWAGAALIACQTAFLVAMGAPVTSSSPTFFVQTPAEVALQRAVGSSVVGCGVLPCWPSLGLLPNVNVVYQVQEFATYEPSTPLKYLTSWRMAAGESGRIGFNVFSPRIMTASVARRYGVGFVLEPAGASGPKGAIFDRKVGDEDLYRIPGAAIATLSPLTLTGAFPMADAAGTPVSVTHPNPASWKLVADKATPQVLRLRLTDVPGWHASIDGRPLKLHPFARIMLQARIPPGRHTVELHYWPTTFTVGLVIAAVSVAGLICVPSFLRVRGRHKSR